MNSSAVGLIGAGAMGVPMALRLLDAGSEVFVHSRTVKSELVTRGAVHVNTPRELVEQVDTILVMLPDIHQLRPMFDGPDSLLASDRSLLVMVGSTSSAVKVRELASFVHAASDGRVEFVDTPVSGGVEGASAGTLSIMVGATLEQFERVQQVLSPCGIVHHLGPLGAGEVAKACNQLIVSATMLALGEATVIAERSGIDTAKLMAVLGGGYAGSTLLEAKKQKLIDDSYEPGGIAAYMLKDLGFANDVASDTKTAAVLLPSLIDAYAELVESGLGDEDLAVVRKFVAERNI